MGSLGQVRTITHLLFVLLLVGLGFLASWIALPVERIEVTGARRLTPEAVARLGGLYAGAPWLYAPSWAERKIAAHPLVSEVKVRRAGRGVLRVELKEKEPFALWQDPLGFPGQHRQGVVLDPRGRPLPLSHAPRVLLGPESDLDAGLELLRRYPKARSVTVGPAGYTLNFGRRRLWLARPEVPAPSPPRGHVYAWGVSIGQ